MASEVEHQIEPSLVMPRTHEAKPGCWLLPVSQGISPADPQVRVQGVVGCVSALGRYCQSFMSQGWLEKVGVAYRVTDLKKNNL